MISQKYELLRKSLLALLSVGDTINHIYSANIRDSYKFLNVIAKEVIIKIFDNEALIIGNELKFKQYFEHIEAYEGELYIWNPLSYLHNSINRKTKIAKMIEIIKLNRTKFSQDE